MLSPPYFAVCHRLASFTIFPPNMTMQLVVIAKRMNFTLTLQYWSLGVPENCNIVLYLVFVMRVFHLRVTFHTMWEEDSFHPPTPDSASIFTLALVFVLQLLGAFLTNTWTISGSILPSHFTYVYTWFNYLNRWIWHCWASEKLYSMVTQTGWRRFTIFTLIYLLISWGFFSFMMSQVESLCLSCCIRYILIFAF